MRHHLQRAKHVYDTRGSKELAKTTLAYLPIEINNLVFRMLNGSGTKIMEEDWDNLIILDACRYDMFSRRIELDGELESRISLGSTSEEFFECNFAQDTFHDTIYVNSNPYLPRLGLDNGTFHAVVDLLEEWDPDLQTVHPETVVKAAQNAYNEFPNKRIIVHFMQPHYPFIGKTGQQIEARGWKKNDDTLEGNSIWGHLRNGTENIDLSVVWKAYLENLDIVLSHVSSLLDTIPGKTVISADHGNLVGERLFPLPTKKKYGHPYGVYTEALVKVPWFIIETEHRREINSDHPIEQQTKSDEVIEDRLQALGYK